MKFNDNDWVKIISSQEAIPITKDWDKPIAKGTMIGFKALGPDRGFTAAYPVYRVIGNEIQFVLFYDRETGKPVIDNTWFTSRDLYTNKDPIIIDIEESSPITLHETLSKIFNSPS